MYVYISARARARVCVCVCIHRLLSRLSEILNDLVLHASDY
jgi:hypothetical protein